MGKKKTITSIAKHIRLNMDYILDGKKDRVNSIYFDEHSGKAFEITIEEYHPRNDSTITGAPQGYHRF